MNGRTSGAWRVAAIALWIVVILAGLGRLWLYAQTPGPAAAAGGEWPHASQLARQPGIPTLVVFAHPQCPCSRATIGELALVMTRLRGAVTAHVVFYRPSDAPAEWERSDLWEAAAAIPGVQVHGDEESVEGRLFDARVSGQTLLYGASGTLLFNGGITAARGHAGDNAGRSAVVSFVTTGTSPVRRTPVFGCYFRGEAVP